jgi:hypothetical protein
MRRLTNEVFHPRRHTLYTASKFDMVLDEGFCFVRIQGCVVALNENSKSDGCTAMTSTMLLLLADLILQCMMHGQ